MHPDTFVELWTRRSVYRVDKTFHCVQVADRATGRDRTDHRCVGTRLGGGRRTQGSQVTITVPLPVPGARALFDERGEHAVLTGTIERVIVQTQRVMLGRSTSL
jgi:hypothetical protein